MRALIASLAAAAWLAGAGAALAHVEVLPGSVPAGEAEFAIRVPTERDVATTRVGVSSRPGDRLQLRRARPRAGGSRRCAVPTGASAASSTAAARIPVGRYADFRVLGTPFEEGLAIWPVRQTYADGQVKPWTGPPEPPGGAEASESGPTDPGPAAAVEIGAPGSSAAGGAASDDDDGGSDAGIWLGVIAIGISLLAAAAVGFLWSTRPARLPERTRAREGGRPAPAARPGHVPAPRRADARRLLQRRLLHLHPGVLEHDDHHPDVVMQVFQRERSVLGGVDEAIAILKLCSGAAWARAVGPGWDRLEVRPCTTGTRSSRGRRCSRSRATTACSPTSRRCTSACWRAAR